MPRFKKIRCPRCGKEKPSYLFETSRKNPEGICIICSGDHRRIFEKRTRKLRKIRIGAYYKGNSLRQTRKQITEVYFGEAGERRIKYLMLDGPYAGQIRNSSEKQFFNGNSPSTAREKSKWTWWEEK